MKLTLSDRQPRVDYPTTPKHRTGKTRPVRTVLVEYLDGLRRPNGGPR